MFLLDFHILEVSDTAVPIPKSYLSVNMVGCLFYQYILFLGVRKGTL